jgi:hypothetical protein
MGEHRETSERLGTAQLPHVNRRGDRAATNNNRTFIVSCNDGAGG